MKKNKTTFLHDNKRKVEVRTEEEAKKVNAEKAYERHYQKSHMLRVLDEIPEKPIGHFTDVSTGEIIQITNEKGFIDVDTFILQFGKPAPKLNALDVLEYDLSSQLTKIFK
jgi:hypothetical protein